MKKKIAYRLPVSPPEKRWLLSCLIRCPGLLAAFKDELRAEHFGPQDSLYGAIWDVVIEHCQSHNHPPDCDGLTTAVWLEVSQAPDRFGNQGEEEVSDFVEQVWDTCDPEESSDDPESLKREIADILRRVREDSLVCELRQDVGAAVDLGGRLMQVRQELDSLLSIGAPPPTRMFPKGWGKEAGVHVFPTNLPFLDCAMEGGHAAGEVNVLLGPMGAGKTTLGIMLAVEAARQGYQIARASGSQVQELAFVVSYEAPMRELWRRALSYAAQIPRKRLEKMGPAGLKSLSTKQSLVDYEKMLFGEALQAGHVVLGEQERAGRAIEWLNKHLVGFDLTGSDAHHPGAGDGYIAAIARLIEKRLRRQGNEAKPRLVVIDYVGAMAKRHLAATNKDERYLRHLVAGAPLEAANKIAHAFNCPVWLLHQLAGEANSKSPGGTYRHTDAADAANFAENADFAFVLGNQDGRGLCQIVCTKHRRAPDRNPVIIQLQGDMGRFVGTGDKCVLQTCTRTIQQRDTAKSTLASVKNGKSGKTKP